MSRAAALADEDYPWIGQPRVFTAVAMPREPGVQLIERRGEQWCKFRLHSLSEARALRDQLDDALRVFDLLPELSERPVAARGYPFRNHRSLAEVSDVEA